MTNIVLVAGSTVADCVGQGNALIAAGDYIQGISLSEGFDKDRVGTNDFTLSFVKNNGHFAGFGGKDKCTLVSTTGSLTQIATAVAPSADDDIIDLNVLTIGSPTTGSPTYHVVYARRTYASS